jgi:hypothetical protein
MYESLLVKKSWAVQNQTEPLGYFEEMIWQYHHGDEPCLLLPSLKELAQNMNCSMLDVQCALNNLRKQGYDYFMVELNSTITVWYPDKITSLSED